jgi:hypothetical protein
MTPGGLVAGMIPVPGFLVRRTLHNYQSLRLLGEAFLTASCITCFPYGKMQMTSTRNESQAEVCSPGINFSTTAEECFEGWIVAS